MPSEMKTPKRETSSRPVVDPSDLSDEARERYVWSDGARKRAAKAYTKYGLAVPERLLYHAVPEFDRLHAAARSRQGSSSGARRASRAMVRRVPPPPEVEEIEGYDAEAFGRSLSALDFVPENAVEAVVATICERSAAKEPELKAQRRRAVELNNTLLNKAFADSLTDPVIVVSTDDE